MGCGYSIVYNNTTQQQVKVQMDGGWNRKANKFFPINAGDTKKWTRGSEVPGKIIWIDPEQKIQTKPLNIHLQKKPKNNQPVEIPKKIAWDPNNISQKVREDHHYGSNQYRNWEINQDKINDMNKKNAGKKKKNRSAQYQVTPNIKFELTFQYQKKYKSCNIDIRDDGIYIKAGTRRKPIGVYFPHNGSGESKNYKVCKIGEPENF